MRDPGGLSCPVEEREGCLVVRPAGVLHRATYAMLRDTLLKCAIEQPKGVIVDLTDLVIDTKSALSVFTTVWLRISDWPAVPLLIAAGQAHTEVLHNAPIRRYVGVYDDVPGALLNVGRPPSRKRAYQVLPHHLASPHAAREFVRQTCRTWQVPTDTMQDAVQIASELVQNTVQHTLSEARLRLELRRGMLTVAVGDDDAAPAVISDPGSDPGTGGKGVLLIAQYAKTWGCVSDEVNWRKTVWAVLGTSGTSLGTSGHRRHW
jgi:anti-sigma regulatory factor (Ser/Thr protein kinase)